MKNPILTLLGSTNIPRVNAAGMMTGANALIDRGFNSFQKVADDLREVKTNRAIGQLLENQDFASNPYDAQPSAMAQLLGINGVDPKTAMALSSGMAAPYIAKQNYEDTKDYRNKMLTLNYLKATKVPPVKPKGYGMVTDDLGNVFSYNKDTGEYKMVKESSLGGLNPKYVTLKTVTSRDENGIETTVQVPFNKLTGQPVNAYVAQRESGGSYMAQNPNGSAYGKYQLIDDTREAIAKRLNVDPKSLKTPLGQELAFKELANEYIGQLKNLGLPVTNENIYAIHQLGYPRAERYFTGNLKIDDLVKMNDNLPKELQSLDPDTVVSNWTNHFLGGNQGAAGPVAEPVAAGQGTVAPSLAPNAPMLPGVGVKHPVIQRADRDYRDNLTNTTAMIKNLETIIDEVPGAFGLLDQYTGQAGAMIGTREGNAQQQARALMSNLLAAFGKAQMAGVLTDQDMAIIRQQIPDVSNTTYQAKVKLNFIKDYLARKNVQWFKRMEASNPGFAFGNVEPGTPTPIGFVKQYNTDTGEYRIVPKEK